MGCDGLVSLSAGFDQQTAQAEKDETANPRDFHGRAIVICRSTEEQIKPA
jgi:hypothetical protein